MPSQDSVPIYTFQPEKRTLGLILSSTSPPIRVPDFQRDYSWDSQQISEFWEDLVAFGGNPKISLVGKEYFLGASVLVNNGTYHLLLDGQQRLATATILLAAIRDKIGEFKADAAEQIQNQYITFQDHLTGARVFKIQMNTFDREFFRDFIQSVPRLNTPPSKKSHRLIKNAYDYFRQKIEEGWASAGPGREGFNWAVHIANTLREHMVLVTVVSNNEKSAASIFATLNDRGIGLSTVDLIRSYTLQHAHESRRQEIIEGWNAMLSSCGTNLAAEALIRISWVSQYGDVKTRALYKIVTEGLEDDEDPVEYVKRLSDDAELFRQYREAESDDGEIREALTALRVLKGNVCYPLLIAASHELTIEENKNLIHALVALLVRYATVCNLDRTRLESVIFATAKLVSEGCSYSEALSRLQEISPGNEQFKASFEQLSFSRTEHGIARYFLKAFDGQMATTEEVTIAEADKVHVEHIYPQTPQSQHRWAEHDEYVRRIGNMTLLDKRLNESVKNADFPTKKRDAYADSRLIITTKLLENENWTPELVRARQGIFCDLALEIWPENLV